MHAQIPHIRTMIKPIIDQTPKGLEGDESVVDGIRVIGTDKATVCCCTSNTYVRYIKSKIATLIGTITIIIYI